MEHRVRIAVSLFATAMGAATSAHAQRDAAHWIRTGTFPTRDAALASGIELDESHSVDLDRDGLADELLTLSSHEDEGQALVIARHDTAGWHLGCVDCDAIGGADLWRQPPVTLPTGVVAVRAHEGRNDGRYNVNQVILYWIAPGAAPVQVYDTLNGGDFRSLAALSDGSLVVTRESAPRFQILRWNAAHTLLTAGRPTRQLPAGMTVVPAASAPAATPTSAPATTAPLCTAMPRASFHLRSTETANSEGQEFPAGTPLEVLALASLTRGTTRMYRVRVGPAGTSGYVFLAPAELAPGCPR